MELHISTEEHELLAQLLQGHQRELLLEIAHADHQEFKAALRRRAELVDEILEKLAVAELAMK